MFEKEKVASSVVVEDEDFDLEDIFDDEESEGDDDDRKKDDQKSLKNPQRFSQFAEDEDEDEGDSDDEDEDDGEAKSRKKPADEDEEDLKTQYISQIKSISRRKQEIEALLNKQKERHLKDVRDKQDLSRGFLKSRIEAAESHLELLEMKRQKAIDDDDRASESDINRKISKIQRDLDDYTRMKSDAEKSDAVKDLEKEYESYSVSPYKTREAEELFNKWVAKNTWVQAPLTREDYQKRAILSDLDKQLGSEGWDPREKTYYKEIERRMNKIMGGEEGEAAKRSGGKAARVAPVNNSASPKKQNAGKAGVTLTSQDYKWMQTIGLDPKNKDHRKQYYISRLNLERR